MKPIVRAYLELHAAVFLFGYTAILGDLISLPAISLVWWRVLFTSLSLLFLVQVGTIAQRLSRRQIFQFIGIGAVVALHWMGFYGAIKLANASIALVCMATTSLFTALLEPLLLRQPFKWLDVALSILVIPGMILVVSSLESNMMLGVWIGLGASLLGALFSILNKKMITQADPFTITFLELGSAWFFLSLLIPFYFLYTPTLKWLPIGWDWLYLLILSLVCTTLAYTLMLRALKHISAFASNLTINLEPVYGIALAWFFLQEHKELSNEFYVGVVLILLAVFSYPLFQKKGV
ncbi:MAG: DMT family transporter [Saprospiraceae bacterium]|nr:DMT family transporter [Saprospiraceae bacterium]